MGIVLRFPHQPPDPFPEPQSLDANRDPVIAAFWEAHKRITNAEKRRTRGNDVGYQCPFCFRTISWTYHLPPLEAGGEVRCAHPLRKVW